MPALYLTFPMLYFGLREKIGLDDPALREQATEEACKRID